jgi:hypothetical protein
MEREELGSGIPKSCIDFFPSYLLPENPGLSLGFPMCKIGLIL